MLDELGAKPDDVDSEIERIRNGLAAESGQQFCRISSAVRGRPQLITGIGLYFFEQFVGINAIIYFAPTIFSKPVSMAGTAALSRPWDRRPQCGDDDRGHAPTRSRRP